MFQNFATLDLLSAGRAAMTVGRGSFIESFPLFGLDLKDYDALFSEKLKLLLKIRETEKVTWSGRFRAPLKDQGIYPRPFQEKLPIWLGVGGTPQSFVRAGSLGLPLMVAIIGGETDQFRPLIDLYREAGSSAGYAPQDLRVGLHSLGYVAETTDQAVNDFFAGYIKTFTEIGKERGWAPITRRHFDIQRGPKGALLLGSPDEVAAKILRHSEALGGIDQVSLQMDAGNLSHEQLKRAIELLGQQVAPQLR